MRNLILQRLAFGAITLLVVSIIIACIVSLLPGDVAQELLGQSATPETVAALRRELGLDVPAYVRYVNWLGNIFSGDLGVSLANRRDVSELIGARLSNTLFLAGLTACIAVPLALAIGILGALYRGSLFDRSMNVLSLTAISFPEFFIAYILVLFLAVKWGIFPAISNVAGGDIDFAERLYRSLLPAIVLTAATTAHMCRMTRAAILDVLSAPYIEMARLKGVPEATIVLRHALPNALAPIINVVLINIAYLIVGVVIVEVVFVYPGLGQLLVDSVSKRDVPVVQACSLIFAAAYILLNLLADTLSIAANPRLREAR